MHRDRTARRPQGTGSIIDQNGVYYGKWRVAGRQVKRKLGPVRTPHRPDGITKTQAEARLRDLIQTVLVSASVERARTLGVTADAWIAHLESTGAKASSIRAYRSALDRWFLPTLNTRSLDRITTEDIESVMARMRKI